MPFLEHCKCSVINKSMVSFALNPLKYPDYLKLTSGTGDTAELGSACLACKNPVFSPQHYRNNKQIISENTNHGAYIYIVFWLLKSLREIRLLASVAKYIKNWNGDLKLWNVVQNPNIVGSVLTEWFIAKCPHRSAEWHWGIIHHYGSVFLATVFYTLGNWSAQS